MQTQWASQLNPLLENFKSIGNILSVSTTPGTSVTLTTSNTIYNLVSQPIPAGIWLLMAFVQFPSLPSNTTQTVVMLSNSPHTMSGTLYDGSSNANSQVSGIGSITQMTGPMPLRLMNSTRYFLNVQAQFSGTAPTALGTFYAVQLGTL